MRKTLIYSHGAIFDNKLNPPDPFSSRFEVFGREPKHIVGEINHQAFEKLKRLLDVGVGGDGRVVVLRSPRAGFGKTFLLQRLAGEYAETHHFVRINLASGRTTDAAHVLEYVLQALCQVLPDAPTLTKLDLLARKVMALGLEPLVASGEVPCQDREGALSALREQPTETFDFHHERAVTAHWTKSNFEILGPRLAAEVARVSGASLREASYWVELLFRFSTTAPDNVERARLLFETVFRSDLQNRSESAAEERLHGLLCLLGTVTRMVLIVDDTEGLSTHPPDALELAAFLTNISQCCPGTLVLLSVNGDVWETAFLPRLPGGLADRLTEYNVALDPLTEDEARDLVANRAGDRADEVLEKINWGDDDLYARHVLKAASDAWEALDYGTTLEVVEKEGENEPEAEPAAEAKGEKEDVAGEDLEDVLDDELDDEVGNLGERGKAPRRAAGSVSSGAAVLGAATVGGIAALKSETSKVTDAVAGLSDGLESGEAGVTILDDAAAEKPAKTESAGKKSEEELAEGAAAEKAGIAASEAEPREAVENPFVAKEPAAELEEGDQPICADESAPIASASPFTAKVEKPVAGPANPFAPKPEGPAGEASPNPFAPKFAEPDAEESPTEPNPPAEKQSAPGPFTPKPDEPAPGISSLFATRREEPAAGEGASPFSALGGERADAKDPADAKDTADATDEADAPDEGEKSASPFAAKSEDSGAEGETAASGNPFAAKPADSTREEKSSPFAVNTPDAPAAEDPNPFAAKPAGPPPLEEANPFKAKSEDPGPGVQSGPFTPKFGQPFSPIGEDSASTPDQDPAGETVPVEPPPVFGASPPPGSDPGANDRPGTTFRGPPPLAESLALKSSALIPPATGADAPFAAVDAPPASFVPPPLVPPSLQESVLAPSGEIDSGEEALADGPSPFAKLTEPSAPLAEAGPESAEPESELEPEPVSPFAALGGGSAEKNLGEVSSIFAPIRPDLAGTLDTENLKPLLEEADEAQRAETPPESLEESPPAFQPAPATPSDSPFAAGSPPASPAPVSPAESEGSFSPGMEGGEPLKPVSSTPEDSPFAPLAGAPSAFKPIVPAEPPGATPFTPFEPLQESPLHGPLGFSEAPENGSQRERTLGPFSEREPSSEPEDKQSSEQPEETPAAEAPSGPALNEEDKDGGGSPFSAIGQPTSAEPPIDGPGSSAEPGSDQDKVDELLRQFKERYGRE